MAAESSVPEPDPAAVTPDDDQPQAANGDVPAPEPPAQDLDFVTLGMFIIGMCTRSLCVCVCVYVCLSLSRSLSSGLRSSHIFRMFRVSA